MKKTDLPRLRDREFERHVCSPGPEMVRKLYVPALTCAVRYDRSCAYYSSSSLSAAAAGFAGMIRNLEALGKKAPKPAIRLLVNEELSENDVRALTEKQDLSVLEKRLKTRFKGNQVAALEKERLAMLAWLVAKEYLDIRVVIPRSGQGIFHTKYGIVYDAHRAKLAFFGSSNESWQGLRQNVDELEVKRSWYAKLDREDIQVREQRFATLWDGTDPNTKTYKLPDALREDLIKFAPDDAPVLEPGLDDLHLPKLLARLQFLAHAAWMPNAGPALDETALVSPWPHQTRVVEDTVRAWPGGRLLCDEVGMGKTIEAILAIRRLLAGRGVKRLLLLVPAGLMRQWQGELREKGGLIVPRYEQGTLQAPGKPEQAATLSEALKEPLLLMSREYARRKNNRDVLLAAEPWDLVLLDEAHAARRSEAKITSFNQANQLLDLLRQLRASGRARSLMLLSATPMQLYTWEPWDLIDLLGLGGYWAADVEHVKDYYRAASVLQQGEDLDELELLTLSNLLADEPGFPEYQNVFGVSPSTAKEWRETIEMFSSDERQQFGIWLTKHAPLHRWMHRNTRETLRDYHQRGMIARPPSQRDVDEIVCELEHPFERQAYQAIKEYVETRAKALEDERRGKGFIMTVYQRRAMSSFHAFRESLLRRQTHLQTQIIGANGYEADGLIERTDVDDLEDEDEWAQIVDQALPEDYFGQADELDSIRELLQLLERIGPEDSKFFRFQEVLSEVRRDGRPVLVFTSYADTLSYLRDKLNPTYGSSLACYTGSGGKIFVNGRWESCTKAEITAQLGQGKLNVVLCTDAASEGLNLQSAGAIINYDLPWNPSRVEQRIGRIDRIGQQWDPIIIRNLLIPGSIDDRVYRVLRQRCGLFERFVGHMQPVLSFARRSLRESAATTAKNLENALVKAAKEAEADVQSKATFSSSAADRVKTGRLVARAKDLEGLFADLIEASVVLPFNVRGLKKGSGWTVSFRGKGSHVVSRDPGLLEEKESATALDLLNPLLIELNHKLDSSLDASPLHVLVRERDSVRLVHVWWLGNDPEPQRVRSYANLMKLLNNWDGSHLSGDELHRLQEHAAHRIDQEFDHLRSDLRRDGIAAISRILRAPEIRLMEQYLRTLVSITGKRSSDAILTDGPKRIQSYQQIVNRAPDAASRISADDVRASALYVETRMRKNAYQGQRQIRAALDDYRWALAHPKS